MKHYNPEAERRQILSELLRLARETYVKSLGDEANATEKELGDLHEEITAKCEKGIKLNHIEQKFLEWIQSQDSDPEFEYLRGCKHESLEEVLKRGWF